MPDPNPELEAELQLQAFKSEIKIILTKDPTISRVKDVEKLLPEDMLLWESWKKWLQSLESFLGNFSLDQLDQKKEEFETLWNGLNTFADSINRRTKDDEQNRTEFAAWLRNLIGGFSPLEAFVEPDEFANPPHDLGLIQKALAEIRANMS